MKYIPGIAFLITIIFCVLTSLDYIENWSSMLRVTLAITILSFIILLISFFWAISTHHNVLALRLISLLFGLFLFALGFLSYPSVRLSILEELAINSERSYNLVKNNPLNKPEMSNKVFIMERYHQATVANMNWRHELKVNKEYPYRINQQRNRAFVFWGLTAIWFLCFFLSKSIYDRLQYDV